MKRPANAGATLERIRRWREICPELTLRSTFIVGFPGETEADFEQLLEFLEAAELDRVGCFTYSPVAGAAANALPDPVPEEVKQERQARLMALQAGISARRLRRKVGQIIKVLVDAHDGEGGAIARSTADAPEIDGVAFIEGGAALPVGEFAEVRIVDADEHDLHAEIVATKGSKRQLRQRGEV
jgi:ribosomal protein S12 methylthiotransferase